MKERMENDNNKIVKAYVDGSFNIDTFESAYGVVILCGNEKFEFCDKVKDDSIIEMRNVAGEISAAIFAMKWCIKNKINKLNIYYDYLGIEKWCTGEWKTNKDGTKKYKKYYDEISKNLDIKFIKIKSHSNDEYNDLADNLAKKALNMC